MAVPARRTSKRRKQRRTHYKVTAPSVNFDELLEITHVLTVYHLKAYYKGRKIAKAASAE